MALKDVSIYLENGILLRAKSFGDDSRLSEGFVTGEAVFNTALSGYQEILSDPSYAGQFIVFCMPEIGIVGCNSKDMEAPKPLATGIVVRNLSRTKSNFRAEENLMDFCKRHGLVGICNIDTRGLTKVLRDEGALMMAATSMDCSKEDLKRALESAPPFGKLDLVKEASTKAPYAHKRSIFDFASMDYGNLDSMDSGLGTAPVPKKSKKIAALDLGIKQGILNELVAVGLEVEVFPCDTKAATLLSKYKAGEIDGVFLSNGPGNPAVLDYLILELKILIEARVPLFGICLGHQLLSHAFGHPTYKLKFGQHGGNHPVKHLESGRLEITAQNHNYNVPESISEVAVITHRNLFDNTIEGVRYKHYPIISVQHHPEASPGPREAREVFKAFAALLDGGDSAKRG